MKFLILKGQFPTPGRIDTFTWPWSLRDKYVAWRYDSPDYASEKKAQILLSGWIQNTIEVLASP